MVVIFSDQIITCLSVPRVVPQIPSARIPATPLIMAPCMDAEAEWNINLLVTAVRADYTSLGHTFGVTATGRLSSPRSVLL
jgi:hypothetical protein